MLATMIDLTLREAFVASCLYEDGVAADQYKLSRYIIDCQRRGFNPDPQVLKTLESVILKGQASAVQANTIQSLGFYAVDVLVVLADQYTFSPPDGVTQEEVVALARSLRSPERNPTRRSGGSVLYSQEV